MRNFLLAACALILICSCKKESVKKINLSGVYTEQLPFAGRSQLTFLSDKLMVRSEPSNNYRDTFYYTITPNHINLKHTKTSYAESKIEFQYIDDTSFKIEDMYPRIPENPVTYMTFKK